MTSRDPAQPDLHSLRIDPSLRDHPPSRGRSWWLVVSVLSACVVLGGWWWKGRDRVPEISVVAVRLVEQGRKDSSVLSASGYVEARRRATVSSKITGQVVELLVEEGMAVDEGQILARLDDTETRAELGRAEAQVAVARAVIAELKVQISDAERTWLRSSQMFERGVISEELRDQAETRKNSLSAQLEIAHGQLAVAESGVTVMQRHLSNFTIRAPFSGIAISKDAQIGEMISPVSAGGGFTRTGIATIVDMASLEVEVDVNESFITRVRPGQRVIAVLDAYPGWEIPASVRTIIPSADRQKATVKVRIAFDELDPRMLPDMGVKVSFLQLGSQNDELELRPANPVVPAQAIGRSEGSPWVWLVLSDSTLIRRSVTIADTLPRGVTILDGLQVGDWVVADASLALTDGQAIKPLR